MAKIYQIGGGGNFYPEQKRQIPITQADQAQNPVQIKLDFDKLPKLYCRVCHSTYFSKVYNLAKVSSLLTGSPQDQLILNGFLICAACKERFNPETAGVEDLEAEEAEEAPEAPEVA